MKTLKQMGKICLKLFKWERCVHYAPVVYPELFNWGSEDIYFSAYSMTYSLEGEEAEVKRLLYHAKHRKLYNTLTKICGHYGISFGTEIYK